MSLYPLCLCGQPIKGVGVALCDACYERTIKLQKERVIDFLLRPIVQY